MLSVGKLPAVAAQRRPLRFGLMTDMHYADRERSGTRYYRDSMAKIEEAVEEFRRAKAGRYEGYNRSIGAPAHASLSG